MWVRFNVLFVRISASFSPSKSRREVLSQNKFYRCCRTFPPRLLVRRRLVYVRSFSCRDLLSTQLFLAESLLCIFIFIFRSVYSRRDNCSSKNQGISFLLLLAFRTYADVVFLKFHVPILEQFSNPSGGFIGK
jgi:hypothetical protein